jgi:S1-C subfamily serine protease
VILALAAAAGVGGYRLGLVARATSWAGMGIGIVLAAQIYDPIASRMRDAGDGRLLLVAAALLLGGAFLGQAIGLLVGARLHHALPAGAARRADRVAGATAGVIGVIIAVWLLAPAMARVDGTAARLARTSVLAKGIASVLPAAPNALRTFEELVGEDFPSVFTDPFAPAPELGPPPAESGLSPELADAIAQSTVKVEAIACGRRQDGSGAVVVAEDTVVTNAHVVAGAESVTVERYPDRELFDAQVVAFDPARDVAVLLAPGLGRPPLGFGDAGEGSVGAAFGHPGGGDLRLAPFRVDREVEATGRDIYDTSPTEREVFFLASQLRPGDSGGALVDPQGLVVGLAFAIAPDDPNVAYALTVEEVQAVAGGPLAPTGAGPCLR